MVKRICDKCGKNVEEYILITSNCDYNLQIRLHEKYEKVDFCNECNKKFQSLIGKFMNEVIDND